MTIDDLGADEVLIWPDNSDAFIVFEAISTQWRTGANGATGLDYNVLPGVMKFCGIKKKRQAEVFYDVRIMEAEALNVMAKQRDTKE